jgi:hypothetical protein
MHYAVTAGIRVGWENLKLIKTRGGFWPTVFEFEKKGKFGLEDLQLANRNVKSVTGWLDLVDNNTSFTEVICDNYEAFVDKKWKRAGDDDGVSKRPNIRHERKDDSAPQNDWNEGGEKKGKERTAPTYRLKSDIE